MIKVKVCAAKILNFRHATKLTRKSLIFHVLIPLGLYCELGGKFDSERYIWPAIPKLSGVFSVFAAAWYKIAFPKDV